MSTKYVLSPFESEARICICECVKETPKSAWIKGVFGVLPNAISRKAKGIDVFDTWAEAHAELTRRADDKLTSARLSLQYAQGFAGNVRGMKPPQEEEPTP